MPLPDASLPHCDKGPDDCFGCKMRYQRRTGAGGVYLPMAFKAANEGGYTQRELFNASVESSKATGQTLLRASRN